MRHTRDDYDDLVSRTIELPYDKRRYRDVRSAVLRYRRRGACHVVVDVIRDWGPAGTTLPPLVQLIGPRPEVDAMLWEIRALR